MNGKEKTKYLLQYHRANRKFEAKHLPRVEKALKGVVRSLIGDIREKGIWSAMTNLSTQLWSDELTKPLLGLYKEVGLFHAKTTYRTIKSEIGQKQLGRSEQWVQDVTRILRETLLQFAVVGTSETLRNHLLLVLQQGIDKGLSVDEMVKMLEGSDFTEMQARRIIRTEVGRAANTGVKVAADSFNVEMQKEWFAFRDQRTRGVKPKDKKDHYHMDGQVVDYNADFVDPRSGERIEFPQAPKGSAAMVINCRCTWAAIPKRDDRGFIISRGSNRNRQIFENTGAVRQAQAAFTPAKTIKEAEKYALESLNLKYANFKGIDIEIANDMNRAIYNIKQVMPKIRTFGIGSAQEANKAIKQEIKEWYYGTKYYQSLVDRSGKDFADRMLNALIKTKVSNVGSNTIAWSTGAKNITISSTGESIDLTKYLGVYVNNKYGNSKEKLDNIVKRNGEQNWFTKGASDFGYIMTHEIGHEIDKSINFRQDKRFLDIFKRERDLGVKQLSEKLSEYGATAGGNRRALEAEMIAEAWAEFITSKSPRPLSKEIGQLMLRKYYEDNSTNIDLDFGTWVTEIMKTISK